MTRTSKLFLGAFLVGHRKPAFAGEAQEAAPWARLYEVDDLRHSFVESPLAATRNGCLNEASNARPAILPAVGLKAQTV